MIALEDVVGRRDLGSARRLEMPASWTLQDELDLICFELLEKLCFIELDGLVNMVHVIFARLPLLSYRFGDKIQLFLMLFVGVNVCE